MVSKVIATLAILYGGLTLIPKLLVLFVMPEGLDFLESIAGRGPVPLPMWFHFAHGLIGSVVWIVAGIFLWKGRDWARWLMIGWAAGVLLLTFAVYGFAPPLALKTGTFAVLAVLLLWRPRGGDQVAAKG